MVNFAEATAVAPQLASGVMRLLPREFQDAFVQSPNVFMFFLSMGLAALVITVFWVVVGMVRASRVARIALRAQALKRTKDHRAHILIGEIEGGGFMLRQLRHLIPVQRYAGRAVSAIPTLQIGAE
jgi:hypothetical protein